MQLIRTTDELVLNAKVIESVYIKTYKDNYEIYATVGDKVYTLAYGFYPDDLYVYKICAKKAYEEVVQVLQEKQDGILDIQDVVKPFNDRIKQLSHSASLAEE